MKRLLMFFVVYSITATVIGVHFVRKNHAWQQSAEVTVDLFQNARLGRIEKMEVTPEVFRSELITARIWSRRLQNELEMAKKENEAYRLLPKQFATTVMPPPSRGLLVMEPISDAEYEPSGLKFYMEECLGRKF